MQIKYYFLGALLLLLMYFQIEDKPLFELNIKDNKYSIILTKKRSFFTYYPKIILVNKTKTIQICSMILPYGYDEDFEILEDIKSIEWENKSTFRINIEKGGRIFKHTQKDYLIFGIDCKQQEIKK